MGIYRMGIIYFVTVTALCTQSISAAETQPGNVDNIIGPSLAEVYMDSSTLVGKSEAYLRRNNRMQKVGHALLISGAITCLAGIIVIEAMGMFAYGALGTVAFVGAGTGIATMLSSFVLLGFSRPYHGPPLDEPSSQHFSSRRSAHLTFVKSF